LLPASDVTARAFNRDQPHWYLEAPRWVGRANLYPPLVPTLVTFGDLADPKTARVVDPYAFEQEFGAGYVFRRAWIEMVPVGIWPLNNLGIYGTPITRGIEKRLAWWNDAGRPAAVAWHAMRDGNDYGASIEPEALFKKK